MLAMFTAAKRKALFSIRNLAIGIDEIASKPTIYENQTTYSELSGYSKKDAISLEKNVAIEMNSIVVLKSDNKIVLKIVL